MRPARAPGRAGGRPVRPRGSEGAVRVRADRGRRAAVRGSAYSTPSTPSTPVGIQTALQVLQAGEWSPNGDRLVT
eukprot:3581175-Prymnesium_polylepis.1